MGVRDRTAEVGRRLGTPITHPAVQRAGTAPLRARRSYRRGDLITAALCLAPALLVIGLFVVYPLVATGLLSLTSWDGISPDRPFVGLDNYGKLIADPAFRNSMVVTVLYGLGVSALSVITGVGAAALLNSAFRGRAVYRTAFFYLSSLPRSPQPRSGATSSMSAVRSTPPSNGSGWAKPTGSVIRTWPW